MDRWDPEGDLLRDGWIFRGHKSHEYALRPTIERQYPFVDWADAEFKALREFQSKAQLYLNAIQLPPITPDHRLAWLGLMQHYGAPTRLLDFTYSPYVALYFALRHREEHTEFIEVWAIDPSLLLAKADQLSRETDKKELSKAGTPPKRGPISLAPEDATSALQATQREDEQRKSWAAAALNPSGVRREDFCRSGFVTLATPPVQNARLSSQQGVFLMNGAEQRTFEDSLECMMQDVSREWYKRFRIPASILKDIEAQLLNYNVHDVSLFPDIEGLAGYVRQRIRLHW